MKDLRVMLSDTPLPAGPPRRNDAPFSAALQDIYTPLTLRDTRGKEAARKRAEKPAKTSRVDEQKRSDEGSACQPWAYLANLPGLYFYRQTGVW